MTRLPVRFHRDTVAPRLNPAFYREAYEDLAPFSDDELHAHWIEYGLKEGRVPSWNGLRRVFSESGITREDFNWPDYLALNQDLLNTPVRTPARSCLHYLHYGRAEGRPGSAPLPTDLLQSLPFSRDDAYWDAKPSQSERSRMPWWDRRTSATFARGAESRLKDVSLEALIVESYLYFRGDVPSFLELKTWCGEVDCGLRTRAEVFFLIAGDRRGLSPEEILRRNEQIDPTMELPSPADRVISVMGFPVMSEAEWRRRADTATVENPSLGALPSWSHGTRPTKTDVNGQPRASVLCSMFRTERFLDSFLGNIAEQTSFHECEFILVLVDPSSHELLTCTEAAEEYPNIIVDHVPRRIGIYEAWNRAVERARGKYITNMNADDLRRSDSLEIQIRHLDDRPWVDVLYQDVLLSIDRSVGWDVLSLVDARTDLPVATTTTFMNKINPPHNAPMWKRSIHDSVGLFDTRYESAGDVDFWLRCARAGKTFLKHNDPHVAYFINPDGMSTRPDGPGVREHRRILREHRDLLTLPRPAKPDPAPYSPSSSAMRADRTTVGLVEEIIRKRRIR